MPSSQNASIFVDFAKPEWLILAPILWVLCIFIARGRIGGWRGGMLGDLRGLTFVAFRCLIVALLCVILAEPRIGRRSKDVASLLVRDVSDSVPLASQREFDAFLAASMRDKLRDDRVGIITVASEASVRSLPETHPDLTTAGDAGVGVGNRGATDLASALTLAHALIPSDAGARVLLATDGNQTQGNALEAVRSLAAKGIAVDVVTLPTDHRPRVVVNKVDTPAWSRPGAVVNAKIMLEADRPTRGRLSLLVNDQLVDLSPPPSKDEALSVAVDLHEGLNTLSVPIKVGQDGVQRFRAVFEPEERETSTFNTDARLMSAESITFVQTRGRVLALTDNPEASRAVLESVRTDEVTVDTLPGTSCPPTLEAMAGYDAIILFDQPASNFSQSQQENLRAFVHDMGGGLLVVGGPESYGAGGWIGSPLAEAFPIKLDPPAKRQLPMGALALVIDQSGSMSAPVQGTGMNQQEIANEAAILGVRALSRLDEVTVVAFSDGENLVVPRTRCTNPADIARRIRDIGPEGGTNLFPAMKMAGEQLTGTPAGVKHMIILTDGQTMGDPAEGIAMAGDLRRAGVTVSTVCIGDAANNDLLKRIAHAGGGRSHSVQSAASKAQLPQIFIKEAKTVRRSLIWEGPGGKGFTPVVTGLSETLRGLNGGLPQVNGYVVAVDRGGLSTVVLRGPESDPILAQWQHGLGRVVTYASDASPRWNPQWMGWAGFQPFWRQQLQWVMRPAGDPSARLSVNTDGENASLSLQLLDTNGDPMNFASVVGRVVAPDGTGRDILLRQVAPGSYRAAIDDVNIGAHVVALRYETNDGGTTRAGTVRGAILRRGGDELRAQRENLALLEQIARTTGGQLYTLGPLGANLWNREGVALPVARKAIWLILALALVGAFVADVAIRRVRIEPKAIGAFFVGLTRPAKSRATSKSETLSAAKSRARAQVQGRMRDAEAEAAEKAARDAVRKQIDLDHARGGDVTLRRETTAAPSTDIPTASTTRKRPNPTDDKQSGDTLSRLGGIKKKLRDGEPPQE